MFVILSSELNAETEKLEKAFKHLITEILIDTMKCLPATQEIWERDTAKAPAIYLNKQINKVAPHKKPNKRGKFKRSNK